VSSNARPWLSEVAAFFARRAPGIVAMESCGSAHFWGRVLSGLGHEVWLIAAQFVRPFVKTNKTDAADAEAIWDTAQRPGMRFVALKSEEQQAVLSLHRMRAQLVKIHATRAYQVRSLLYEFGVVVPKGFCRPQGTGRNGAGSVGGLIRCRSWHG